MTDHYLPSRPDTVSWGWIQGAGSEPVLVMKPGQTVTIDTISHEGILEDQGRDPVAFFARYGVPADDVLADAVALARSGVAHDPDRDGPHVVTGPIAVEGAEPGDILTIEVLDLALRAPYGIISSRHGRGALAGEMPESEPVVCRFASVDTRRAVAKVHGPDVALPLPLRPFLGLVGVGPSGTGAHSVPPGLHGGNLDVRLLGVGSRLHLPVQSERALLQVGDPHFAQGDGEVALTALEGPLRATLRVDLVKPARSRANPEVTADHGRPYPFGETEDAWLVLGLHEDLDTAVQIATRNAVDFVVARTGADRATAYAWLSVAADLSVSQVVDRVKGVHFALPKVWLDQAGPV